MTQEQNETSEERVKRLEYENNLLILAVIPLLNEKKIIEALDKVTLEGNGLWGKIAARCSILKTKAENESTGLRGRIDGLNRSLQTARSRALEAERDRDENAFKYREILERLRNAEKSLEERDQELMTVLSERDKLKARLDQS